MNLSLRHVAQIGFRFRQIEGTVVLAPHDQEARLPLAEPGLPFRIGVDVSQIIRQEIRLNFGLSRLTEKRKFICSEIRVVSLQATIASDLTL